MSSPAPKTISLLREAGERQRQGRHGDAVLLLRQAVALDPDFGDGWDALGVACKDAGLYEDAVAAFAEAVARGCRRPHEAHQHRAVVFADHLRRDEDAEQALRSALKLQPDYLPALLNLGNLFEQRGQRDDALGCYAKVLDQPSLLAGPYGALTDVALARTAIICPPTTLDDPLLARLSTSAETRSADPLISVHLWFALGHSLDRLGAIERAFDAFARGNRCLLRLHGRGYDRRHEERLTDALIGAFPTAANGSVQAETRGPAPLFICGMFRSGSTLVEQVLAAHPRVVAGGEVDWLMRLAAERMSPFPASARGLSDQRAMALGTEYREHLSRLFPQAGDDGLITDKRPDNFKLIGLIKRLLPAARIIHTTRHPIDNGLSVFMQHMNLQVTPYANDLGDIGHYYGQYRRLMEHWQALYADSIFHFDYDSFVREPRATLQGLLEFLGLNWDDRCLAFHELRNTVKTASYWQVRRPLYGNASGRWLRYGALLQPLIDSLLAAGAIDPNELGAEGPRQHLGPE